MATLYLGTETTIYFKLVQDADDETPVTGIAESNIDIYIGSGTSFTQLTGPAINEIGRGWYSFVLDLTGGYAVGPLVVEAVAPGTNVWSFLYDAVDRTLTSTDQGAIAQYLMTVSLSIISANASAPAQTDRNLLNFIRSGLGQNRLTIPTMSGDAISMREDDVTPARTYTVTTDVAGAPISEIDPV